MADDADALEDRPSSLPDCPSCGEPVGVVTASGLYSGTAYPCGCSVNPIPLTRDRDDRGLGSGTE